MNLDARSLTAEAGSDGGERAEVRSRLTVAEVGGEVELKGVLREVGTGGGGLRCDPEGGGNVGRVEAGGIGGAAMAGVGVGDCESPGLER